MADCSNISVNGTSYACKDAVARRVVSKTYNGLCPQLPNESTTTKYLRQDGTWVVPPNTTYNIVSKTANGLCPQLPNESTTTKYLRQDGTWVVPPNTTYNVVAKGSNGLCPALPNESTTTKYLRQDGTWVKPPNTTTGTSYNAGSCPDNTTFGTNGSIARAYTALNEKFNHDAIGNATGTNSISYTKANINSTLTLLLKRVINNINYYWQMTIPATALPTNSTYQYYVCGDSHSQFIVGINSTTIVLNTALYDNADIRSQITTYAYGY